MSHLYIKVLLPIWRPTVIICTACCNVKLFPCLHSGFTVYCLWLSQQIQTILLHSTHWPVFTIVTVFFAVGTEFIERRTRELILTYLSESKLLLQTTKLFSKIFEFITKQTANQNTVALVSSYFIFSLFPSEWQKCVVWCRFVITN
jgi:hypothetical protein